MKTILNGSRAKNLIELLELWAGLSDTSKELIFSYLVGYSECLENEKRFEKLKKEMQFTGTLSL